MAYLDEYEEEEAKSFPFKVVAIVVAILLLLGIGGFVALRLLSSPSGDGTPTDTGTTATIVENDEQSEETQSDVTDVTETPIESEETVTDVNGDDDGDDDTSDDEGQSPDESYDGPEYKSSAISMEQKLAMTEGNEITDETEQKYAQYGALNIGQMRDVAERWTGEWTAMVNDGKWDEHSTVLKSLMDQGYVNNHGTEFEVQWLYECLHDTLYVSSESMLFRDIKDVHIINSVPSPLTYMSIEVNVTYQDVENPTDGTVTYRMALNRNYQVCQFHVAL
jgi:hypothetical protein